VLLARGGVKVIDFGIARAFEATSQHTRTDQLVGTVAYMAPERFDPANGRQVGPAADIFAWGAVVAYAASGRTPFAADSAPATAMRILTQPPDLSGVPESLRAVVEWTLAKDPAQRPTARQLLDVLLAGGAAPAQAAGAVPVAAAVPDSTTPVVTVGKAHTSTTLGAGARRRGWLSSAWAAVAVVVVLAAAGLAGVTLVPDPGNEPATSPQALTNPSAARPAPSPSPSPSPSDTNASILRGNRRTLLHIAEIDKDLALDYHWYEVEASDGKGTRSQFVLVPMGVDYLIKSLRSEGRADDSEDCLGVKVDPDKASTLVAASCTPTRATLFFLSPTGTKDDKGRPTYYIGNESYGFVQWSTERKVVYVQQVDDAAPSASFSLVDRGEL
jgi:hypothetical protein